MQDLFSEDLKKFCIEDFEILHKLGKGKFGDVFYAKEKKMGFMVALKVMKKSRIEQLKAQKNIVREICIHSYIEHENIVQMYGFFHDDNNVYLILEYAPEGELYKILKKLELGRFSEERGKNIIR